MSSPRLPSSLAQIVRKTRALAAKYPAGHPVERNSEYVVDLI